uniref:G-protein coupled receptors family 1 profile domain-containing protein n=1 Tax=Gorilla gorilla gorilla TaxID=9595 RepID=A0A2I2ZX92_GORGO
IETSPVLGFVLLGLSLEKTFFVFILLVYLVILLGNGVLILVTILDSRLHTPMYFFLGNLSFLDISCAVQMFLSFAMGATECVLLSMKAFDHYVDICNPLRYPVVMSKAAYVPMAVSSWAAGITNSVILAVLKLACADISINVISMVVANMIFLALPVLFIFVLYVFIIATILRIPSAEGRKKAFSTCSAHLTVVIVFYGTILFMYGKPKSKDPMGADKQDLADKLISIFYGVVTPILNPIIYSPRNKDLKAAMRNLVAQKHLTE